MESKKRSVCNYYTKLAVAEPNRLSCRCGTISQNRILKNSELLNKQKSACSPRHCPIFDKCDEDLYLQDSNNLKPAKNRSYNNNTLGDPIGLIPSTVCFKTDNEGLDIARARFATYLVAFARFYLNPVTTWDSTVIDDVLKCGLMLYVAWFENDNELVSPQEIYSLREQNILPEFELMGYGFQIEVRKNLQKLSLFTEGTPEIHDGSFQSFLFLENVKSVLKSILREQRYYLLSVNEFYLMIWLCKGVYFVFDICGRKVGNFRSDDKNGVAMLMCFKTLDNISHLILNLSGLRKEDPFDIRELRIVQVITPIGDIVQCEYDIINDDYACMRGSLHLSLNPSEVLRNRSALSAGVIAMALSKINHPATWNTKTVDKIISFGVKFCHAFQLLSFNCSDADEFPVYFNIGQFRVHIELCTNKYTGFWRCVPYYKLTDLAEVVKKAFDENEFHKLLLQINYQVYAVWKQKGFIYLFDPFRHRILGLTKLEPMENQIRTNEKSIVKYATVRMFRSFDVFMTVLNSILVDSNRSSPFSLHAIKLRHIQLKDKSDGTLATFEESTLGSDDEVISLNEVVYLEESENMCQKMLREVSDFEEEDMYSDIHELELKTSSSELEIIEEKIEDKVTSEEMEDLESSSSDKDKQEKRGGGDFTTFKHKIAFKDMEKMEEEPEKDEDIKAVESKQNRIKESLGEIGRLKLGLDPRLGKRIQRDVDTDTKKKDTCKMLWRHRLKEQSLKHKIAAIGAIVERTQLFQNINFFSSTPNPNRFPGFTGNPVDMEIVCSKSGRYGSLYRRIYAGFRKADRLLILTPWGNFIVFCCIVNNIRSYFLFDGCTCNINRFRHLDLSMGTAGLLFFQDISDIVKCIQSKDKRQMRAKEDEDQTSLDRQLKKQQLKHGNENVRADDENFQNIKRFYSIPNPNRYPGFTGRPIDMEVICSASVDHRNLCKRMYKGFRKTDRMLVVTPWGKFAAFCCITNHTRNYFLYDGCTCNINRFRHWNLSMGTAGLLFFQSINEIVQYIRDKNTRQKFREKTLWYRQFGPQKIKHGTEAIRANDENFQNLRCVCSIPYSNRCQSFLGKPTDTEVVCSESGNYNSLCKRIYDGFQKTDRMLVVTPWGKFTIFYCSISNTRNYFLYDACICKINDSRDFNFGMDPTGLLCFREINDMVNYMCIDVNTRQCAYYS
uniref:Uncharacterized protein n=1 Tax=Glossina brevipalpis TaxID=37001 RepID=A0A1A9W8A3_9MUSC